MDGLLVEPTPATPSVPTPIVVHSSSITLIVARPIRRILLQRQELVLRSLRSRLPPPWMESRSSSKVTFATRRSVPTSRIVEDVSRVVNRVTRLETVPTVRPRLKRTISLLQRPVITTLLPPPKLKSRLPMKSIILNRLTSPTPVNLRPPLRSFPIWSPRTKPLPLRESSKPNRH